MKTIPREIRIYIAPNKSRPFKKWVNKMKDKKTQTIIRNRIERVGFGNLGDHKPITKDIYELRIHHGPGYRVYFSKVKHVIVLLLCGGEKKNQKSDIEKAKKYWEDFKTREL